MRLRLIAVLFSTLLNMPNATFANDWKTIRIAVEGAYPPFSALAPDGNLVGFDIDIARALCEQMQAQCTLVQQDWDGMIPALLARKFDAIVASMTITQERKKRIAFSNRYYTSPTRFAAAKNRKIVISDDGLNGLVIGVQRATIYDNFISERFGAMVQIKRYATQDEAYLDALAGRVDLLLADAVGMQTGFLSSDKGQHWHLIGPVYTDPKYFGEGSGIAMRQAEPALLENFNQALATIRSNGVYKRINDKYFDFDLYGE